MEPTVGAVELARCLKERGLSTSQAEELLGLAKWSGYVSRFATGKRKPSRSVAVRIEVEFGIPVRLWEEPFPKTPPPRRRRSSSPASGGAS